MDKIIGAQPFWTDEGLAMTEQGVAYQKKMTCISYDESYFAKFDSYDPEMTRKLTEARIEFVGRHWKYSMVDIGCGNGDFVMRRPHTVGFDINPEVRIKLRAIGRFASSFGMAHNMYRAMSMWDVIEHVPAPEIYLNRLGQGSFLFISLPIFDELEHVFSSKHYRPNEHLYYFTEDGLLWWLSEYGFTVVDKSDHETRLGREEIGAYAFIRERPGPS